MKISSISSAIFTLLSIFIISIGLISCSTSNENKVVFTFILQEDNLEDYEIEDLLDAEENTTTLEQKKAEEKELMLSEEELEEDTELEALLLTEDDPSDVKDLPPSGDVVLGATQIVAPSVGAKKEVDQSRCRIFYAVARGTTETTRWHLKHCDINTRHKETGDTPLIFAVKNKRADQVRLLLRRGAEKNIKNNEGLTALDVAKKLKNNYLIKILSQ